MVNTKCIKINNNVLDTLKNDFEHNLQINNIQSYFPILSLFLEFYNESNTSFILNSTYLVTKLIEPIKVKKDDSYIKNFFDATILNKYTNEKTDQKIFTKILPILNVSQAMMNDYNTYHNSKLPNIFHNLTNKKINNYNNSAYIDSFFSFLGSKLTEENKCPTFPLFFGTFTGIADEFMYDISEEYNSIKQTSWYKKNVNKHFKIHNTDIDSNTFENINIECSDIHDILKEYNSDGEAESNPPSDGEVESHPPSDGEAESKPPSDDEAESNPPSDGEAESKPPSDGEADSDSNSNISSNMLQHYDSLSLCSSKLSLSNSDIYELNYCCFVDFPVQINCIEMLSYTLDNYIDNTNNNISDEEWTSILFQTCFGLAVAQKQYDFVHNDLHSSNIMFNDTSKEYMYYNFKGNYFKLPTFGKITKIIDFGRATFNYKNKLFFSDVFRKNGEAEGQYNYPYYNNLDKCKIKPNKSFDLSRLATTIIEHFDKDSDLYKLLKLWCMDKHGNFLMDLEDDFNLYRTIAKYVKSAVPKNQINKLIFKKFIVNKSDIPENEIIYNY